MRANVSPGGRVSLSWDISVLQAPDWLVGGVLGGWGLYKCPSMVSQIQTLSCTLVSTSTLYTRTHAMRTHAHMHNCKHIHKHTFTHAWTQPYTHGPTPIHTHIPALKHEKTQNPTLQLLSQ